MANIKSAKKRIRVTETKTARNKRVKNRIKGLIKDFNTLISENNISEAEQKLKLIEKKVAQGGAKKVYHKNTAARKISVLTKRLNRAKGGETVKAPVKDTKPAPVSETKTEPDTKTETEVKTEPENLKADNAESENNEKSE